MSELGSEMDALPNTSTNILLDMDLQPTSPAILDCNNNRMSTPYNHNAPNDVYLEKLRKKILLYFNKDEQVDQDVQNYFSQILIN